jgi:DNA-binding SARP family transcriptional activator
MFGSTLLRRSRIENLFDAWTFAADEACRALEAWRTSHPSDRGEAFAVYRAALDREDQAAVVLAARVLPAAA